MRLAVSLAGGGGGDGGDGGSGGVGGGDGDSGGVGGVDGGGGGPSPSSASTRAAAPVPWLPLHAPSSRSTASSATAPRLGGRPGSRTGIRRSSSERLDWLSVVRKSCWKAAVARCGWVSARRRCAVAAKRAGRNVPDALPVDSLPILVSLIPMSTVLSSRTHTFGQPQMQCCTSHSMAPSMSPLHSSRASRACFALNPIATSCATSAAAAASIAASRALFALPPPRLLGPASAAAAAVEGNGSQSTSIASAAAAPRRPRPPALPATIGSGSLQGRHQRKSARNFAGLAHSGKLTWCEHPNRRNPTAPEPTNPPPLQYRSLPAVTAARRPPCACRPQPWLLAPAWKQ